MAETISATDDPLEGLTVEQMAWLDGKDYEIALEIIKNPDAYLDPDNDYFKLVRVMRADRAPTPAEEPPEYAGGSRFLAIQIENIERRMLDLRGKDYKRAKGERDSLTKRLRRFSGF